MANVSPNPLQPPPHGAVIASLPTYEGRMSQDLEWALTQGSLFFEGRGKVQETLRRIVERLDALGVPYAVVGGMALFAHGFRRYTESVEILVTREGLKRIHEALEGRGYLPPIERSKHLRDAETNVRIEFLTTGGYPGDGKPKPVAFPDPEAVVEMRQGIKCARLTTLIELKLASGMSSAHRGKDLTDVEELIKVLNLPESLAEQLDPYVRDKYLELWRKLRFSATRYVRLWRNRWLAPEARSLDELVGGLRRATEDLEAMLADGVQLDDGRPATDDYVWLYTYDRTIAEKYGMQPEDAYFQDEGDGS